MLRLDVFDQRRFAVLGSLFFGLCVGLVLSLYLWPSRAIMGLSGRITRALSTAQRLSCQRCAIGFVMADDVPVTPAADD